MLGRFNYSPSMFEVELDSEIRAFSSDDCIVLELVVGESQEPVGYDLAVRNTDTGEVERHNLTADNAGFLICEIELDLIEEVITPIPDTIR